MSVIYNVSKIENWYDDFVSCRNKFANTYLEDYQNCYIKSCSDSDVIKIKNNLNEKYSRINRIFNNINKYWTQYINDVKNVDNVLSGKVKSGSVNGASASSKLSKLPTLEEYKCNLDIKIKSLSGVIGAPNLLQWSEDKTLDENLLNTFEKTGASVATFLEKTGATIATAGVSLMEGITKLVEDAVDLLALSGTVYTTGYTAAIDLVSFVASKVTGNESLKTNYTKQLWDKTRSFVSTNYTKQVFDSFYDNTSVGQWMKNNAYGFDVVRDVGAEIGEVVGVIALSIVTGGSAAVIYGAAKSAEHIEENWQDENTSTFGGLAKGSLEGVLDGVFFEVGMKGDKIAQTAAKKVIEKGGKTFLKKSAILGGKMIFEGCTSVAQDSSSILLDTLFSDNKIVDQNGQVITFTNFSDKLNYYYNQAGGTKGLMTSVVTASALSFMSDSFDIYGVKSGTAIKNADIELNSNQIGKNASDINIKNINSNGSKVYSEVEISQLKKEYDELLNWKSSDKFLTDEAYYQAYGNKIGGNPYKKNMDRITELEGILNSKKIDESYVRVGVSKYESDELYRFNKEKYKNIPGYENYYDLNRIKRNKSNLDRASEILNEWGKKQGIDNYAEQALRKYADTGSAYVDGRSYITRKDGVRQYIESLNSEDVALYLRNKTIDGTTLSKSDSINLYSFFRNYGSSYDSTYGVNQGGIADLCNYYLNGKKYTYRQARDLVNKAYTNGEVIPKFNKKGTNEYFYLKDKLIQKGLTENQASVILSSVDDVGACSYAAKANSIFYKFSNNPKLFEKKFGFPMYKVNSNGEKILNSNELLLDMYLFVNDKSNGGNLFFKNYDNSYTFFNDNRIDVFGRKMLDTNKQVYMSTSAGSNNDALSRYLNSKGLEWSSYNLIKNNPNNVLADNEFSAYINHIAESINDGKAVQLNIFSHGGKIDMYSTNPNIYKSYSTKDWVRRETNSVGETIEKHGGHAVFITGLDNNGFFVSSWGREYKILYSDLKNGGFFNIIIDDINSMIN